MASNGGVGTQPARSQSHSHPHMPRLSYRNSVTGTILQGRRDSVNTFSTATITASGSTVLPSSPPKAYSPSPPRSKVTTDVQSTFGSDALSVSNSPSSPEASTMPSKKRASSLFGFLSVKEPSQQAFLDYEESIRKQSAARNGRITAVGLPGVSSAKLPRTVPRVNSKWDGVPQTLKEKEKEKRDASRPALMSHRHSSSNATEGGMKAQKSSSTLGSRRSSTKSTSSSESKAGNHSDSRVTKLDWESYTFANSSGLKGLSRTSTHSSDSPSTPTLPEMTSFCPQDVPEPPKIPAQYRRQTSTKVPSHIDVPQYSASPSLTPVETSPVTPYPPSSPIGDPTSFSLKSETVTDDDSNDSGKLLERFERVTLNSNGANILAPPSTLKRRPNGYAFSAGKANPARMSPDDQPSSILKQDPSVRKSEVPARPPVSSYFPVVDAEPKRRSDITRNKHNSALILKHKEIAPWEWDEPPMKGDAHNRSPTPTKPSGKAGMRKRLSVFG